MTSQSKTYLKKIRLLWKGMALVLLLSVGVSCLNMDEESVDNTPTAYVSFFNGTTVDREIKITVDERVYDRRHFDFGHYIDYWYFYTGSRNFSFKDPATDQSLLDTAVTLEVEKAYSFFMTEQGGEIKTLFTEDKLNLPESGNALIRLVHLSSDSPEIAVYRSGVSDPLFSEQEYMEITDFINVSAGETDLVLMDADGNEEWARLNEVHLREGRIYTLILRGDQQAASTTEQGLHLQLIRNYPNY
ncbi:protein of unknown function [Cyclobacterium xiamenense]|uniref:DUF4397 domain-containing protein n=1 Tax=Cyclobacterium xiamenense TaxID=1297121 RepID=A0A1H6YKY0_9BACT|nr:DUF4397 domain-containing protein [Cyclobacterium xiamenense]SEJ39607.1 protein of unknown function [Cyclobacterium xiamenense]